MIVAHSKGNSGETMEVKWLTFLKIQNFISEL